MFLFNQSTIPEEEDLYEPDETEELMEKGSVSKSIYGQYFKAGGLTAIAFLIILLLVAQAITNASDIWLTYWYVIELQR